MRLLRALGLLLALSGALAGAYIWLRPPAPPAVPHNPTAARSAAAAQPPLADSSGSVPAQADAARVEDMTPQSFVRRLRCTQIRFFYQRVASPEVLSLLCERHPLRVLQIEAPLAEAGDLRAIEVVGILANNGHCEQLTPPPASPQSGDHLLAVAQKNGASPETVRRLAALLAEQRTGPTAEELAACQQAGAEFGRLRPGPPKQALERAGRPPQALSTQQSLDDNIESARKMLVTGDAHGEEELAQLLLERGTPDSEREALALLRDAARTSPSAKSALANCLLRGCPTPDPDPTEAHELLAQAAVAGDLEALMTLAAPANPGGRDLDPSLAPSERYAWSQFLRRLHEEGCFGATDYSAWATFPAQAPNLLALSPADAAAAENRAAELLATQLEQTRQRLGCD